MQLNENKRRICMTVVGIFLCGISVGMFNFSTFGMDPFQVFAHGLWSLTSISYGTFYTILNLVMLIAIFFIDRSKIGLGTILNIFLIGYLVDFSTYILTSLMPTPDLVERVIFLLIGILIMCVASSLYFTANLGVSTYDAVALIISEKYPVKFKYCRLVGDLVCTIIGFALGAVIGVGTIVTAFFMGPLIAYFNEKISSPLRYGKQK